MSDGLDVRAMVETIRKQPYALHPQEGAALVAEIDRLKEQLATVATERDEMANKSDGFQLDLAHACEQLSQIYVCADNALWGRLDMKEALESILEATGMGGEHGRNI